MPDALASALRFMRLTQCEVAERVTPTAFGSALRCERLPGSPQPNCLIVHEPAQRPPAQELIALADVTHGELAQRRVVVEDETLGSELAPGFRAAGWTLERQLVMTLEPAGETRPAARADVGELDPRAARPIEARIDREAMEQVGMRDERVLEDLLDYLDAMRAARRGRCFGSGGASVCTLLSDGATAQIEEVGTMPEARGRGLGRATVQAAIDAARGERHALVFLVADADDWPRELYASLGFAPVGTRHVFSRYFAGS